MLAGEFFVRAVSRRVKGDFGFVKLGFDVSLVVLSAVISLVFMSSIKGVREGTVAAAVLVGPIVHFIRPWFNVLDGWLHEERTEDSLSKKDALSVAQSKVIREIAAKGSCIMLGRCGDYVLKVQSDVV